MLRPTVQNMPCRQAAHAGTAYRPKRPASAFVVIERFAADCVGPIMHGPMGLNGIIVHFCEISFDYLGCLK